ncbi:hypothetical protein [Agrobacterium tumefaciens]|uniref:hypothetical protein n=1 Tax=Agrobacterium tumefaciens TaxID=358 RepID=UPI001B89EB7F
MIAEAVQPLNKAQCEDVRRALPTRMDADRYQLEALVRTHFRGQFITDQQRRWCYYSVWRPDMLPQAIGLHDVAGGLLDGELVRLPRSLDLRQPACFHDLLIEALFHDGVVGLRVPLSRFTTFKERIEELLPRIDFLIAGRMIGPQLENTLKATHKLSNPLVRAHTPSPKPSLNLTPDPDHEDRPQTDHSGLGMTLNSSRG